MSNSGSNSSPSTASKVIAVALLVIVAYIIWHIIKWAFATFLPVLVIAAILWFIIFRSHRRRA